MFQESENNSNLQQFDQINRIEMYSLPHQVETNFVKNIQHYLKVSGRVAPLVISACF